MNIEQLRQMVNSLKPDELQEFADEARLRYSLNRLLDKPVREHLLAATMQLVKERMTALGLHPKPKKQDKPEAIVHTIDRRFRPAEYNGKVKVTVVGRKEMEKLWI